MLNNEIDICEHIHNVHCAALLKPANYLRCKVYQRDNSIFEEVIFNRKGFA